MANAHLNLEERIELEAALRAGDTQAIIAIRLARSAGTISRELALNGGPGSYRATEAHHAAQGRRGAARRGDCAIDEHPPLRAEVHERLHRGWSPEEIAGSLKRDHPDLPLMHTSHESIYRYVYIVARGELQRELASFRWSRSTWIPQSDWRERTQRTQRQIFFRIRLPQCVHPAGEISERP